jgi:hypothetical protein
MIKLLSLDEVVANAMTIIPGVKKEMRPYFDQWAWLALRQLGPVKENLAVATLTLEDLSFAKPSDFISAIDIALFNAAGEELKYHYRSGKQRIHNTEETNSCFIEVSEGDQYYYVSSNADTAGINHAVLRYYAMPLDENGRPVIQDYMTVAIMAFCRWMWELREGKGSSGEAMWRVEAARARSKGKMPDMLQGKQIARTWMTMIDKFDPYKY